MPIAIKNTAMPILNNQFPIIYHKRKRAKGERKIFCVYGKNSSLIRNRYV